MTINDFLEHVKARKPLDTPEIHRFMNEKNDEAGRIPFKLNGSYHTRNDR